MGLLDEFRAQVASSRLTDEALYAAAIREMESGVRRDGLYAKALADAEGDVTRAAGLYIKLRVQSMKDATALESNRLAELKRLEDNRVRDEAARQRALQRAEADRLAEERRLASERKNAVQRAEQAQAERERQAAADRIIANDLGAKARVQREREAAEKNRQHQRLLANVAKRIAKKKKLAENWRFRYGLRLIKAGVTVAALVPVALLLFVGTNSPAAIMSAVYEAWPITDLYGDYILVYCAGGAAFLAAIMFTFGRLLAIGYSE